MNARSAASGSTAPAGDDPVSALIVEGLGGANNLSDVDCCATRLRCTVKDAALVKQDVLKASGASGVICKGDGVQVVYGPKVAVIKAKLEDYLENAPKTPGAPAAPAPAPRRPTQQQKDTVLSACLNGTVVPLAEVKDEAFASGALGDGIAIEPIDGELVAPADGEISSTFETHHAVGMTTVDGAELLMHIGIDTVKLGGKHFTYLAFFNVEDRYFPEERIASACSFRLKSARHHAIAIPPAIPRAARKVCSPKCSAADKSLETTAFMQ